jgi:hypothetical protein
MFLIRLKDIAPGARMDYPGEHGVLINAESIVYITELPDGGAEIFVKSGLTNGNTKGFRVKATEYRGIRPLIESLIPSIVEAPADKAVEAKEPVKVEEKQPETLVGALFGTAADSKEEAKVEVAQAAPAVTLVAPLVQSDKKTEVDY